MMGTRKKKDRRKNKRGAQATMAGQRRGANEPTGPQRTACELEDDSCADGCDRCASPCVTSVAGEEFDRWMEQSSKQSEKREEQFREMVDTPAGTMMRNANGNRRPALLLPPARMFSELPKLSVCGDEFEPLREAWLSRGVHGPVGPAEFVACDLPRRGLRDLWNTYAYLEQFYMDVWSLLGAEASRDSMTVEPPRDAAAMESALRAALDAFRQASEEQEREDPGYLYAYDNIHIAEDPEVEHLLRSVAAGSEDYRAGESDRRGSYLHFVEASGASDHTATAAGYAAAVKVLRENGIACEQWSSWD